MNSYEFEKALSNIYTGKLYFCSKAGKVEKVVDAHSGAVSSLKWNYEASAILSGMHLNYESLHPEILYLKLGRMAKLKSGQKLECCVVFLSRAVCHRLLKLCWHN